MELVGLDWAAGVVVTAGPAEGATLGELATLSRLSRQILVGLADRGAAATEREMYAARIVVSQLPGLDEDLLSVARRARVSR